MIASSLLNDKTNENLKKTPVVQTLIIHIKKSNNAELFSRSGSDAAVRIQDDTNNEKFRECPLTERNELIRNFHTKRIITDRT